MAISQLKTLLLFKGGREELLPGALSLWFWGVELLDGNFVMDYGIPAQSRIEVRVVRGETIIVFDTSGERSKYQFGERDTVETALMTVQFWRPTHPKVMIFSNGIEQEMSTLLKDIEKRELHLKERRQMTIETSEGPCTIDVASDCTVSVLAGLLAERMAVEVSQVCLFVVGEWLADVNQCVFSVPGQICVEIRCMDSPSSLTGSTSDYVRDFEQMKEIRRLGDGSLGVVTLVEDPETGKLIALKSIAIGISSGRREIVLDFMKEVEELIQLVHPCVLEIVGCSLPMDDRPARIGMRFAANGSLKEAIAQRHDGTTPSFLDDTGIAIIVCGIILGMQFIHSKGMIHRNLQPSNILINERGFACIGDLGNSRLIDLDVTSTKHIGSPIYMAPELFEEEDCTSVVDVYSFALIVYELLVGESVFQSAIPLGALMDMMASGIRPELPASLNETVKDIIEKGWAIDPSVRYSFDEIWLRLKSINFQLTPNVNYSRIFRFISWVRMNSQELEPSASPSQPPVPERSASVNLPLAQPCKVVSNGVLYTFWAPQKERDPFSLECERGSRVADIRDQMAHHLGYPVELVQLLFGGRMLRDPLLLDNLEIGDGMIIVHVREGHDQSYGRLIHDMLR
jgi:serine/threonine protein kinase